MRPSNLSVSVAVAVALAVSVAVAIVMVGRDNASMAVGEAAMVKNKTRLPSGPMDSLSDTVPRRREAYPVEPSSAAWRGTAG
jgi:hypothetical protein